MESPLVQVLVTAMLGGGAATGVAALMRARNERQRDSRDDRKLPAELDSIIVGGAEQAVTTMARALKHANETLAAQADELETERRARQRVERELRQTQATVHKLERELADVQRKLDDTAADLAGIRKRGAGHGHQRLGERGRADDEGYEGGA